MIPRRLIRTVPAETTQQVEDWWDHWCAMHPDWQHMTFRDPIDPEHFPLTSPYWGRCSSGAQLAGLVRLEALYHGGGIYLDSDVQPYRSLHPLLGVSAFAAWEDNKVIPDAVLGAEAGHPAIRDCIEMAISELPRGAWYSGPGVTTAILPRYSDVLLLPPGSWYPTHYREVGLPRGDVPRDNPWAFGEHMWNASWLPPEKRPGYKRAR